MDQTADHGRLFASFTQYTVTITQVQESVSDFNLKLLRAGVWVPIFLNPEVKWRLRIHAEITMPSPTLLGGKGIKTRTDIPIGAATANQN